ncbi:hypothetical protein SCHPADRAFT_998783 [Schizopora paradoxa]|uniref:Uncharacterized protein n=1 Tax=Schizopora paradoxa TaxID=27342 RepID=A0A0H2RIK3_9AGAM|nr:hypothetical protein SCHPADRAFT_998783 [Schizopora paradoxa]
MQLAIFVMGLINQTVRIEMRSGVDAMAHPPYDSSYNEPECITLQFRLPERPGDPPFSSPIIWDEVLKSIHEDGPRYYISLMEQKFSTLVLNIKYPKSESDFEWIRFWYTQAYGIRLLLRCKMDMHQFDKKTVPTALEVVMAITKLNGFLERARDAMRRVGLLVPVLVSNLPTLQ